MIVKDRKETTNLESEGGPDQLEGVFKLSDRSLKLSKNVLRRAKTQLKKTFSSVPRSLFSQRIPSPYIRREGSNPLHFTQNGQFLMYFTKTEFIKLSLPTGELSLRRRLRDDLSPIFYDYNTWSHDSTKVLVSQPQSSEEIKYNTNKRAFIYDTATGEYTDLFQKFQQNFEASNRQGPTVCCFNPLFSDQLVIYHLRVFEGWGRWGPYPNEGVLYNWNWKKNQKREILIYNSRGFTPRVITHKDKIIVFYVFGTSGNYYRLKKKQNIHYVKVYSANGFKELVGLKKLARFNLNHPKTLYDFSYVRKASEVENGKICFNDSDENLIILDIPQRRLKLDFVETEEVSSVFEVLPSSLANQEYFGTEIEDFDEFRFVRGKVLFAHNCFLLCSIFGNRIKTSLKSNILARIVILERKGPRRTIKIEIFDKKRLAEVAGAEKQRKGQKLPKRAYNGCLLNTIEFRVADVLVRPKLKQFKFRNKISQACSNVLHIQELNVVKGSNKPKRRLTRYQTARREIEGDSNNFLLSRKEIDLETLLLQKIELYCEQAIPGLESGLFYQQRGHITDLFGYSVQSRPTSNFMISFCMANSKQDRSQMCLSFVKDLRNSQLFLWKSKFRSFFEKKGLDSSWKHIREDVMHRLELRRNHLLTLEFDESEKISEEVDPILCKILNLKTKSVTEGRVYLDSSNNQKHFIVNDVVENRETEVEGGSQRQEDGNMKALKRAEGIGQLILTKCSTLAHRGDFEGGKIPSLTYAKIKEGEAGSVSQIQGNVTKWISELLGAASHNPTQLITLGELIFAFTVDIQTKSILIKAYKNKEGDQLESSNSWEIKLDPNFFKKIEPESLKKTRRTSFENGLKVVRFEEGAEDESVGPARSLEGLILLSAAPKKYFYWNEDPKTWRIRLAVRFVLPLAEPQEDLNTPLVIIGESRSLALLDIPNIEVSRALFNREKAVVEIIEDCYYDVAQNRIFGRDFEGELERLWRDLSNLTEENVVYVLVRLASLGYEFSDLVEELKVREILEGLNQRGWSEGINYFNLRFDSE